MKCPNCESEMDLGSNYGVDWAHQCGVCGYIVCQSCGHVMKSLDEADVYEVRTGYNYDCPECETQVYSVDMWAE